MIKIGNQILNYQILSLVGEGGMGSVYLATDLLQRKLAIKILDPILTKNSEYVERFIREAKMLSSMDHPGIIKVYQFFEHEGSYYMVMEFAEGEILKILIQRIGPINEKRAILILKKISDALCFAHVNGITHRDIKPENIIVDKNDNIKILDFGIAKLLNDYSLTRTGTKMGTVYYMSPEQIKGEINIDIRTDIYSLGIVFYEMLTGKLPFRTDTDSDFIIMKEIIESEIKDPRIFYPHISDSTVNLLKRMIMKDKEMRISSLDEVLTFSSEQTTNAKTSQESYEIKSIESNYNNNNIVICPNCKKELELDEQELRNNLYVCPLCYSVNNIDVGSKIFNKSESTGKVKMFQNAFSFKGRIRRTEYGLSLLLFYFILILIGSIIPHGSNISGIVILFYIPLYWFILAQGAKRCHDLNNNGWFQIIPLYVFWLIFTEGDICDNDYGHNPKGLIN